jgi:hypothetical protein
LALSISLEFPAENSFNKLIGDMRGVMRDLDNTSLNNSDLDLIHLLVMITKSLERTIAIRFIGQSKVTTEQDSVLQMLSIRSKLSIDELSAMLVREYNTIASLITRMERAVLVLKHKD